jgi:SNF2 family DNA or RNA helicase
VDLPPTIYSDRHISLSSEQQKHYRELLQQAVTEVQGQQVTAVNAAVLIGKVIQAACGVMYSEGRSVVKVDYSPRLKVLKEIIEECEQKVIVFVPLTGALNAVAADLRKHWTVEIVDGSVGVNKRNRIFADFRRSKDPHVLVANAAAMSHGLTLTEASTIVWYAPTNSNDVYNQANARIVRPGQNHTTNIVHLYATPEERRIYQGLKEKTRLQDVVLELAKGGK